VLNGLERFSIETIRINHKVLGNFTDAQLIALTLFALGIAGCLYVWKKGERMKVGQSGPETGEE
jgi:prolipoprotein diacylglyceryltransferase